jgi:hypothetical protein
VIWIGLSESIAPTTKSRAVQWKRVVKTVRLTTKLDASREVRIPVPVELHTGDTVEIEATFLDPPTPQVSNGKSWKELVDSVAGIFEDCPLELPDDPPPTPVDFGK